MMNSVGFLFVIGRILFGGYFIMSGLNHFKHLKMLTGYAQGKGVMMPREAVFVTGVMMVLGGAGIFFGFWVSFSVLLISVFLLVTTFQMHQFWKVTDQMARMGEEINFKKNLALLGALLLLLSVPESAWISF